MEIYEKQLRAPAEGLTTRGLFIWLQDIAGDQCVGYHLAEPDMKARGLPSPDDGDALALTFAAPVRKNRQIRQITADDIEW